MLNVTEEAFIVGLRKNGEGDSGFPRGEEGFDIFKLSMDKQIKFITNCN